MEEGGGKPGRRGRWWGGAGGGQGWGLASQVAYLEPDFGAGGV